MSHYYNLLLKINDFIENGKFTSALEIIDKELLMPYVPEKIEKELILQRNKISAVLINKEIKNSVKMKQYSEEEIISYLESKNYQVVSSVLQYLSKINLRSIILAIKEALIDEKISTDIKKVIIRICLNQGINDKVKVFIHDKHYELNLSELVWVENDQRYQEILSKIYDDVYSDSPQLYLTAKTCLIKYFLNFWPLINEIKNINSKDLKNKIIEEAKELFK